MNNFRSVNNKWLTVGKNVVLTNIIDPVIAELDPWFEQFGVRAVITSGLRDAQRQLMIIQHLAEQHGIDQEFPEIRRATLDGITNFAAQAVPVWAPAWSRLLNLGVIVNPPKPCVTLFDYNRRDASGKLTRYRRAGYRIGTSPHFEGTAFDVGGGANKKITEELAPVKAAFESREIKWLKGYLPEHDNNAIHCDCLPR